MLDEDKTKEQLISELHKLRKRVAELENDEEERKRARETAHWYELLPAHSRDIFLLVRCDNGRILEANVAATKAYSYSYEELLTLTIQDLRGPDTRELIVEQIVEQMEDAGLRGILFETVHQRKDGSTFPVEVSSQGATIGGTRCLISVARDITERKWAEESLKQNRNRLEKINECLLELGPDHNSNINRLTSLCGELLGGTCALYNRLEGGMLCSKGQWQTPPDFKAKDTPAGHICYDLIRDDKEDVILIADLLQTSYGESDPNVRAYGLQTYFGHVVKSEGNRVGSLCVVYQTNYRPSDDDRRVLGIIASAIGNEDKRKQVQEALQESERIFATVFQWSPFAVTLTSFPEGKYVDVNETFLREMGYTRDEVIGRTFRELGVFSNRRDQEKVRAELLEHGRMHGQECRFKTKSGRILTCLISSVSIAIGGKSCVLSSVIDISGRKRAEKALQAHEERLRLAMEATQQGWFDLNVQTGEVSVSPEYARMIGYEPAEFKTSLQGWIDGIHPEDRNAVLKAYRECLETADTRTMEYRRLTKTGTWKWIRSVGKIVGFDSENKPLRMTGTHADISERKRAEAALQESEELYRTLVSLSPDAISMADPNGLLTFTSPKARQMFGHSPDDEIVGRSLLYWVAPEEQEKASTNIRHLLTEGTLIATEYTLIRKDGTRFIGELNAAVMHSPDGSPMRMIIITRDITERKRAEEAREKLQAQLNQAQKMESVGRLAGGVAHDFNNMLGIILGHTEMALDQVDPAQPLFAGLQEIRKAAERSADLTRQLLAFARKQTVAPKVLDLNETVEGMLKMLRRLIGEDIDLAWLPGKNLWPVKVDPSQIDQILANLCVNARDAIAGVGKVTIETGPTAFDEAYCAGHAGFVPGEYVLLAVRDDGCGMDKEPLARLFEPFFTTKAVGKGTGLGLATVYGIVKQNNGFINVYSEPGQGSTFNIYLPRHQGKAEQLQKEGPAGPAGRSHETILLVEDEPAILRMTTMMLERQGYTVLAADTPGEAIRLAEAHPGEIHLLMTDVIMPEMNGRDLAKNLLSLYPNLKRLFMSGYTANVIAHHGVLDAGVNFIQKPFSMQNLAAKLREALGGDDQ